jgi:hypothetical protein
MHGMGGHSMGAHDVGMHDVVMHNMVMHNVGVHRLALPYIVWTCFFSGKKFVLICNNKKCTVCFFPIISISLNCFMQIRQ